MDLLKLILKSFFIQIVCSEVYAQTTAVSQHLLPYIETKAGFMRLDIAVEKHGGRATVIEAKEVVLTSVEGKSFTIREQTGFNEATAFFFPKHSPVEFVFIKSLKKASLYLNGRPLPGFSTDENGNGKVTANIKLSENPTNIELRLPKKNENADLVLNKVGTVKCHKQQKYKCSYLP